MPSWVINALSGDRINKIPNSESLLQCLDISLLVKISKFSKYIHIFITETGKIIKTRMEIDIIDRQKPKFNWDFINLRVKRDTTSVIFWRLALIKIQERRLWHWQIDINDDYYLPCPLIVVYKWPKCFYAELIK